MSKEHSYLRILAANASIQHHLASILEAKAKEMFKASSWTLLHVRHTDYPDHDSHVKESIKIHEQMIEVIEGITKVETGLARHIKILLGSDGESNDSGSGSGTDLGSLFDLNG